MTVVVVGMPDNSESLQMSIEMQHLPKRQQRKCCKPQGADASGLDHSTRLLFDESARVNAGPSFFPSGWKKIFFLILSSCLKVLHQFFCLTIEQASYSKDCEAPLG